MKYVIKIEITNELLLQEVKNWFDDMFTKSNSFDFTVVREGLEFLKQESIIKTAPLVFCRSLHCVDYADMHDDTIEKLKEICYKIINCDIK